MPDKTDPIYTIAPDGASITCHQCGRTSHSENDVKHRYCGNCRAFLDDEATRAEVTAVTAWHEYNKHLPMQGHFDPDDKDAITSAWDRRKAMMALESGNPVIIRAFGKEITAMTLSADVDSDEEIEKLTHIGACIAHAVRGFYLRLAMRRPMWKAENGEWFFAICQPATFFDNYIVKLVIQDICNETGRGVKLGRCQPQPNSPPMFGRNPDVLFREKKD